jgi:carbonic anhydrase
MCNRCGDVHHKYEESVSRRRFLGAGAVALAALSGAVKAADPPKPGSPPPPNAVAPAVALKRLMDGNARYAANKPTERDFSATRAARAQAQYPMASILSCADSRVVPDLVFDQSPGDLFVCRVAGNVMTMDLLASLEYGVQFLGSPMILVLGHSNCGAVDAALKVVKSNAQLPGHLPELITAIKPAAITGAKLAPNDMLNYAIADNVRRQVLRLKAAAPIVAKAYRDRKIDIAGGVYDIATGKVTLV